MASAIIKLLSALFSVLPTFKEIVERAIEASKALNEAEAVKRKQQKDKAVDNAIDGNNNPNNDA